jgi:hypothetical protein
VLRSQHRVYDGRGEVARTQDVWGAEGISGRVKFLLLQMTGRRVGMPFVLSTPTLALRFRQNNGPTPSGDYQPSRSLSMAGSEGGLCHFDARYISRYTLIRYLKADEELRNSFDDVKLNEIDDGIYSRCCLPIFLARLALSLSLAELFFLFSIFPPCVFILVYLLYGLYFLCIKYLKLTAGI